MTTATAVREKPIIFGAEMVRAIFEGRKTQTRRVIKPQPEFTQIHDYKGERIYEGENRMWCWRDLVLENIWDFPDNDDRKTLAGRCPYGKPGDRLWVKEAVWRDSRDPNVVIYAATPEWGRYKNDNVPLRSKFIDDGTPSRDECQRNLEQSKFWKKTSSRFTPRWASRINLETVNVRVERVQDIRRLDAQAEGIEVCSYCQRLSRMANCYCSETYAKLWDSINAKRGFGWDKNPWVWVTEFRRVA